MGIELKSDSDRLSYALAMNFAISIKQLPVKVDLPFLGNAVADLLNGGELLLSNAEYGEQMRKLQQMLQEVEEKKNAASEEILAAEKKFFEENAIPAVTDHPGHIRSGSKTDIRQFQKFLCR